MRKFPIVLTATMFLAAAGVATQVYVKHSEVASNVARSPVSAPSVEPRAAKARESVPTAERPVVNDRPILPRARPTEHGASLEEQLASLRTLDDQDLSRLAKEVKAELAAKDYTTLANRDALSAEERQHFAALMTKADAVGIVILERKVDNAEKAVEEASEQIANGKESQP